MWTQALDVLAKHGPSAITVFFFAVFVGIALWSWSPRNRERFESYGKIPFCDGDGAK